MIGVYLLFVIIITNSMVLLCLSHAIPKGFHISRTCRPVCEPEETCVIYKTSDGSARSVCVLVDPHQMVLDGTILVPVKNPLNSSKRLNPSKTDSVLQNQILDIGTLIQPSKNDVVEAVPKTDSVLQKQILDIGTLIKPSQNDFVEAAPKTDSVLQKQILDLGNLIKSSQNDVVEAAPQTDSVLQKQILDIGNIIEPSQNDVVETVRMKATDKRPKSILINQLTALSQSIRHELLWKLDSLGEGIRNPDYEKDHEKSTPPNSVKDISASNSKTFDSRKDKLSGLYFVRDENGRVVFRRVKQNSTERPASEKLSTTRKMKGEFTTIFNIANKKPAVNSSQTRFTTPAVIRMPHIRTDETNGITGVLGNGTMSCKSCDPDHACPAGYYCYFSATCAKQICQPL